MKKKILALTAAAAVAAGSFAVARADNEITVLLDDKPIEFSDVAPQIVNDRTLVPFRAIFEALGYEVDWEQETQTVSGMKGDLSLAMVIGKTEATVKNGEDSTTVSFDVPPQIIDDRTMVPVRAVAEMSGYKVDWEDSTRTVVITSPADIVTGPGPAAPEATADPSATAAPEATADPKATAAPVGSADSNATATPAPAGDLPITFDAASEQGAGYERNFELLTAVKNAEGKYDITFRFETFQEGPGSVDVHYNCLDASGKVVDSFGGSYRSTDYTWTFQNASAAISGDTVKIALDKK